VGTEEVVMYFVKFSHTESNHILEIDPLSSQAYNCFASIAF